MVLPLIAIGAITAVSVAIPFLFPTKAEKATIELNEKLSASNRVLIADKNGLPAQDEKKGTSLDFLKDKKNQIIIVIAVIIFIFLFMVIK